MSIQTADILAKLTEEIRAINALIISGEYHTAQYAINDAVKLCRRAEIEVEHKGFDSCTIAPFVAYGHQIGFSYEMDYGASHISGTETPRAV